MHGATAARLSQGCLALEVCQQQIQSAFRSDATGSLITTRSVTRVIKGSGKQGAASLTEGCKWQTALRRKSTWRQGLGQSMQSQASPIVASHLAPITATPDGRSLGVVITGGSKGLGFAMAREFLARGDRVLLCGRDAAKMETAVAALKREFPSASCEGVRCDVSSLEDVADLAKQAATLLGTVHIWVNNAGEVTGKCLLSELASEEIGRVVGTNVLGSLLCCKEAINIMQKQAASSAPAYHIFNMGFSAWGAKFSKSACTHKATKTALAQLSESLAEELKEAGVTSVGVHNLSPGMVLTDLLLKDSTPLARRFFNTLAEEPETVAADLVPKMRAVSGSGSSIEFLNPALAVGKVVLGLPQIIQGGRFFDKEGNRVKVEGQQYASNGVRMLF